MEYQFPVIENIDCILEAIKGYDEFIVKRDEENGVLIVNYIFTTPKSFLHPDHFETLQEKLNAALRKECRGIEFDLNSGKIVTRKYHKFHNVNEKPEYMSGSIDWTQRHWVLEKVDGSMITPYLRKDGTIQYHTKMGRTQVSEPVNTFVKDSKVLYDAFVQSCFLIGVTPMFEWCSRQQKIVVDYEEETLILTAMRYNVSGEYIEYDKMKYLASIYRIPCVKAYDMSIENPNDFLKHIADMSDAEGVVVRFASGHMCKVKADWYMKLHNSIDIVKYEKNIVDIFVNDLMDDLRPTLITGTKEPMEKFEEDFQNNILESAKRLQAIVDENKLIHDKKSFALNVVPKMDKMDAGLTFRIWGGDDSIVAIKNLIKKNCGSCYAVDDVRKYFGNIRWMDYYNPPIDDEENNL